jgi:hypothetical protein
VVYSAIGFHHCPGLVRIPKGTVEALRIQNWQSIVGGIRLPRLELFSDSNK